LPRAIGGRILVRVPGSVPDPSSDEPIKVLVVDDHPALRDGLEGLLRQEAGLLSVGALPGPDRLGEVLARTRPDVVVLDYALHRGDGLSLCFRLKQRPEPPGVVLYSAYVDPVFAVPATLAQADGIVSKTAPVEELLEVVRRVARGIRQMPALDPDAMRAASSRLAADDLPIAGMLFSGVAVGEIAETLGLHPREVRARALGIIGGFQARDRIAVGDAETRQPAFSVG
jgi:DNA-binding NarL/FixJ family response regulator